MNETERYRIRRLPTEQLEELMNESLNSEIADEAEAELGRRDYDASDPACDYAG
jgi:hypothetical protein